MALRRFVFIYGLTVIYDIRDIEADKAVGMRTITIWLGEKKTRLVALLALCTFVLLIALDPQLRGDSQSTALYLSA